MEQDKAQKYEVGYAKPPRHAQFKKGHSGNPKGRPRGAKNLATVLEQALGERITITDKGKRKSVTKMELILMQLVNKAAQGDHRSARLIMAYLEKHIGSQEEQTQLTMREFLKHAIIPDRQSPPAVLPSKSYSMS